MSMLQSLTQQQMLFAACLFGAVTMAAYVIINLILKGDRDPLRERLQGGVNRLSVALEQPGCSAGALPPVVQPFSKAVAEPLMPKNREEVSRVRRRFAHAGIYSTAAIQLFVTC